ncbi:hypothetical protein Tco_1204649 [Tanacetum coccineum]
MKAINSTTLMIKRFMLMMSSRKKVKDTQVIYGLAIQHPPLNSSIPIEAWSCSDLHNQWRHPTLKNTPLTNQASTLANPAIIPTFVEANYEVLESLLKGRRKKMSNEDLCTKLDYYSEEYDEEMEMEPRPTRVREATPVLRTGSSHA